MRPAWRRAIPVPACPSRASLLRSTPPPKALGVALAIRALVGTDLAAGRVVAPHPFVRLTTPAFTLLHETSRHAEAALGALREWLLEEAEAAL